jgi:hypothetical protein
MAPDAKCHEAQVVFEEDAPEVKRWAEFRPCGPPFLDQGCVARVQLIEECDAVFEGREIEII